MMEDGTGVYNTESRVIFLIWLALMIAIVLGIIGVLK
jgi:hypothetical protein